jgi:dTDP-4-amino-4,6-dideoxygalactose transaminase
MVDAPPSSVIACRDRSAAITLALDAALPEREDADELVVPALLGEHWAGAALDAGLTVVPAEIDGETLTVSARGLARAAGPSTRAVVAIHAFGHPPPIREIARIGEQQRLTVIEDASGALGAAFLDRPAGSLGAVSVVAFDEGGVVSGGGTGAGVIVRDTDDAAAARARADPIDDEAARIALSEVRRAPEVLHARRQLAWHLTYELRALRGVSAMAHSRWVTHAYDRYLVRLSSLLWKRPLDETIEALRAEGIACELPLGTPLHLDERVIAALGADDERLQGGQFATAAKARSEFVAVPLSSEATTADMNDVAEAFVRLTAASVPSDDARTPRRTGGPW